jgi:type II secretory pathway predicted ATPase ExeA
MNDEILNDDDFDGPDEEERRVRERRLFTYSVQALKVAASVDRVCIVHPAFKAALTACDRAFQLSRELSQQQIIVVAGATGVGKTALIRYFRASLPGSSLFEQGLGAIAIRLPAKPNVGHLVGALLRQLKHPFPQVTGQTLFIKRDLLIEALRQRGTRMLFIDEGQHLRDQSKMRSRNSDGTTVTDCIRELVDESPIAACICGTQEILQLSDVDRSLDNRVSARFQLEAFSDNAMWKAFLSAFRKHCGQIDLSIIEDSEHVKKLFVATEGNPRSFKRLVTEAVLICVDENASAVTKEHFKRAFERVSGGVSRIGNPYA